MVDSYSSICSTDLLLLSRQDTRECFWCLFASVGPWRSCSFAVRKREAGTTRTTLRPTMQLLNTSANSHFQLVHTHDLNTIRLPHGISETTSMCSCSVWKQRLAYRSSGHKIFSASAASNRNGPTTRRTYGYAGLHSRRSLGAGVFYIVLRPPAHQLLIPMAHCAWSGARNAVQALSCGLNFVLVLSLCALECQLPLTLLCGWFTDIRFLGCPQTSRLPLVCQT